MKIPDGHRARGGKVRRGGLAEQVLRGTRRRAIDAAVAVDDVAANIAQLVYVFARDMRRSGERPVLPIEIEAPLLVACEQTAQRLAKQHGMPVDERTISDLAAYLVWSWRQRAEMFNPGEFEVWREQITRG